MVRLLNKCSIETHITNESSIPQSYPPAQIQEFSSQEGQPLPLSHYHHLYGNNLLTSLLKCIKKIPVLYDILDLSLPFSRLNTCSVSYLEFHKQFLPKPSLRFFHGLQSPLQNAAQFQCLLLNCSCTCPNTLSLRQ